MSELPRPTRSTPSPSATIAFQRVREWRSASRARFSDLETAPVGRGGDFGVCLTEGNEGLGPSIVRPKRGGGRRGGRRG